MTQGAPTHTVLHKARLLSAHRACAKSCSSIAAKKICRTHMWWQSHTQKLSHTTAPTT